MRKQLVGNASTPLPSRLQDHFSIASRTFAALAGGYALASLVDATLALTLPMPREEAILAAGMAAFLVYPAAAIWAFVASSAWTVWFGLLTPSAILGVAVWMLRGGLS
jgi:hypothetical protein